MDNMENCKMHILSTDSSDHFKLFRYIKYNCRSSFLEAYKFNKSSNFGRFRFMDASDKVLFGLKSIEIEIVKNKSSVLVDDDSFTCDIYVWFYTKEDKSDKTLLVSADENKYNALYVYTFKKSEFDIHNEEQWINENVKYYIDINKLNLNIAFNSKVIDRYKEAHPSVNLDFKSFNIIEIQISIIKNNKTPDLISNICDFLEDKFEGSIVQYVKDSAEYDISVIVDWKNLLKFIEFIMHNTENKTNQLYTELKQKLEENKLFNEIQKCDDVDTLCIENIGVDIITLAGDINIAYTTMHIENPTYSDIKNASRVQSSYYVMELKDAQLLFDTVVKIFNSTIIHCARYCENMFIENIKGLSNFKYDTVSVDFKFTDMGLKFNPVDIRIFVNGIFIIGRKYNKKYTHDNSLPKYNYEVTEMIKIN